MLVCKLCGFESEKNLASHIFPAHHMYCDEYKTMFPGEIVFKHSQESRIQIGLSQKENYNDPVFVEEARKRNAAPTHSQWKKEYWIIKHGYTEEEAIKKVSELQTRIPTQKTKNKISVSVAGQKNPSSYKSVMERNNCTKQEAKKLMPCYGRTGDTHPMWQKHHTPEALQKIANSYVSARKRQKSCLEIELFEALKKDIDTLESNKAVFSHYICDVVYEDSKRIVEFFGDFWHCNPAIWGGDDYNKIMKMKASERWAHDDKKIKKLNELGYEVFIVWEADFNNNKDLSIELAKNFLQGK